MDDQAETVLLELIRGGGPAAFSGIRPAYMGVVRPLTDVRRSEVAAFCRALGLRPRIDPTNRDTRFLRNAIRLRVIPAMEEATGRDVTEPIARSASLVRGLLDRIDPALASGGFDVGEFDGGVGRLSVEKLGWLPPQHAGEAVKWMLRTAGFDVSRAHVDAILDLAKGRPGRRVSLPGGFTAVREREYIRISSPDDP